MTTGLHFLIYGLTFSVLGDTVGHLWDHPEALERTLGTTLAHLRNQTPKNIKKSLFWDLFWESNLMTFRVFICPCFYMCSKRGKPGPNVTKCAEKGA